MMSDAPNSTTMGDAGVDSGDSAAQILLADDNPGDVGLLERAFDHLDRPTTLHTVSDGREALEFLCGEDGAEAQPQPDLVLLDLNMPRMDGNDVLRAISEDPALRRIPVVVLTSSAAEDDVIRSYSLYANAYITKPMDFQGYLTIAERLERFWLETVTIPPA
jgi:CheY-like chemotaxis protein